MKKTMKVNGMSCGHCKARVEKALNDLTGVHAEVSLEDQAAFITMDQAVSDEMLREAVTEAGYEVAEISEG